MLILNRQSARACIAILLLVAGPLQAQVSMYCAMMDMHRTGAMAEADCCCDEIDQAVLAADNGDACCAIDIALGINAEAPSFIAPMSASFVESDVDPPDISPPAPAFSDPAVRPAKLHPPVHLAVPQFAARPAYLITRRLRI